MFITNDKKHEERWFFHRYKNRQMETKRMSE